MNIKQFFLLLTLQSTIILSAQNGNKLKARTKQVIDSTMNSLITKNKVVGASIAIVHNNEVVYATGYGYSDREKKIPATAQTIYRIGSCTKAFTALAILQLQQKGKVDVSHSVRKYIPELTIHSRFNDNNQIIISEMLAHTSGLPGDIINGFFCDSPPDMNWLINELNKQTMASPRLYKHAYSNVAYGLLGEVISRTENTTYNNYIKKNIFEPLGMTSSYIENDSLLTPRFSKAYCDNKLMIDPMIRDQAAGLIHSNVEDMSRFIQLYLNRGEYNGKNILPEKLIREQEKNHLAKVLLSRDDNWGYGLYTQSAKVKNEKDSSLVHIIGHGGDTYAFHSDFKYIPELNIGAVILTNTDRGMYIAEAERLIKLYLKEERGEKLGPDRELAEDTISVKEEQLSDIRDIGGYYNFGEMLIKVKNADEFKLKQGPVVVKFSKARDCQTKYTAKAMVFGLIPSKIKNQEFYFVRINGNTYLKCLHTKFNQADYMVKKSTIEPLTTAWRKRLGKYKAINKIYSCTNCKYMNLDGMKMKLKEEKGFIVIELKAKSEDSHAKMFLEVVSDSLAVTGGIGRGTGETVRVLENGNIYYNGFEFKLDD